MKITIKDIAKEAGVSVSTISYVLNKRSRIKKESHRKILEIVKKYNYMPDPNAKSLVTGVSNNIGLIIVTKNDDLKFFRPYMNRCLMEMTKRINKSFGWLSVCLVEKFDVIALKPFLSSTKVDGLILMHAYYSSEVMKFLDSRGTPYITMGGLNIKGNQVQCDEYAGIKSAFEHLVSTGHKKIMFVAGSTYNIGKKYEDLDMRCKAYIDEIGENKFNYKTMLACNYSEKNAYFAIKDYIENENEMPDAIIAANDVMAYGIIRALNEKGIKIPQDISIIGFDDADVDYNEDIGLTSVRQPILDMMTASIDYVYQCIDQGKKEKVNFNFQPELIIRRTTMVRE